MKYILIQNDGEVEINSFRLIGASTKRDDKTKIGFFGSGLKYSIAYMLRNKINFRIFSGLNEVLVTTQVSSLREKEFDSICINDEITSFTTTMGPTWSEDWFVLREVYCNALDESNCQLIRNAISPAGSEGKTRIYIEETAGLRPVLDNWDAYFAEDRIPLFTANDVYTSCIADGKHKQIVKVYANTQGVIFRKGIRVYSNDKYIYDYGYEEVNINEDRTARNPSYLDYAICSMTSSLQSESYITTILRDGTRVEDGKYCREYAALCSFDYHTPFSERWLKYSEDYMLVLRNKSGTPKVMEKIALSSKEVLLLPDSVAYYMKKDLPNVNILGMGKLKGKVMMHDVETTPKMDFLLKDVIKQLAEMKYPICYPISVVSFEDAQQRGFADIEERHIYISDKSFDEGRKHIALVLMEESEHIISGKGDETREFQSHIFNCWLTSMENSTGLFL